MDEALRTQVPLGSFHPPDAQSWPGDLGPRKSLSGTWAALASGFTVELPRAWRETDVVKAFSWAFVP